MKIVIGIFLVLTIGTVLIGYLTSDTTHLAFGFKKFASKEDEFVLGLSKSSYISDDETMTMDEFTIGAYFFAFTFLFTKENK